MKKKKTTYHSDSKFSDNFYLITGSLFILSLSFYLISLGKTWISLLLSLLVTFVAFGVARERKKGWWIFLGILAIIFDILNVTATVQLFF